MRDFRTSIAESFELLSWNRKYALLYVGSIVISPIVGLTDTLGLASIIVLLLTWYIECGLLGSLKEDIVNGRSSTFVDLHAYAKKYIFRVFGINLVAGMIVSIPLAVITVYKLVMSFNSIEDPMWVSVVLALGTALAMVWSAGAACYAVYHDKGIFESLKGGLSAVYDNRRIFIILFGFFLLSSPSYSDTLDESLRKGYFVWVCNGIIRASALVLAYAYVMLSFRKAAQLPVEVE